MNHEIIEAKPDGADAAALRLETGIYQDAAIALYESFGFRRRSPFGEYREDPFSLYFEMKLD